MTLDTWVGIIGLVLALIGILATIWAAFDARRQRSSREKAVIAATSVIERTYGLLIGIKPAIPTERDGVVKAIENGMSAIDQQRATLKEL